MVLQGVALGRSSADFPQNVVEAFNPMIEKTKAMQKHLETENNRLATLRDTLLPKLMSGELKVNDM